MFFISYLLVEIIHVTAILSSDIISKFTGILTAHLLSRSLNVVQNSVECVQVLILVTPIIIYKKKQFLLFYLSPVEPLKK